MLERTQAAILFPGQGCSPTASGELVRLYCADLLEQARQHLGGDPLADAGRGTRYAQPAIFLASLAGWRAAQIAGVTPLAFAGHSLGELTALAAAGVLAADDALDLVILRARLMEEVSEENPGGMVAVLKGTVEQAEWLAAECGVFIANYNAPGQIVLSGSKPRLNAAAKVAREHGLRALHLSVSGAFHSPAMAAARAPFEQALLAVNRRTIRTLVFSGMTAAPFTDEPAELAAALTTPVRWSETMTGLARRGVSTFLDVGPECVLARLSNRNVPSATALDLGAIGVCA